MATANVYEMAQIKADLYVSNVQSVTYFQLLIHLFFFGVIAL